MNIEELTQAKGLFKNAQDGSLDELRSGGGDNKTLIDELYDYAECDKKWGLLWCEKRKSLFLNRHHRFMSTICIGGSFDKPLISRNYEIVFPPAPMPEGVTVGDILNSVESVDVEMNQSRIQRNYSILDLELHNRFYNHKNPGAASAPFVDNDGRLHIPFVCVVPNLPHVEAGNSIKVGISFDVGKIQPLTASHDKDAFKRWQAKEEQIRTYIDAFENNDNFYVAYDECLYSSPLPMLYTSVALQTCDTGTNRINLLKNAPDVPSFCNNPVRLNFNHPTYLLAIKLWSRRDGEFVNFDTTTDALYRNLEYKLVLNRGVKDETEYIIFKGRLADFLDIKMKMGIDMPETLIIPFMNPVPIADFSILGSETINFSRIQKADLFISPVETSNILLHNYVTDPAADAYSIDVSITALYNHIFSVHGKRTDKQCQYSGSYVFHYSK